jgi:hypothetical protein
MNDNEIRQILIERKRQAREAERREEVKEIAEGILCWVCWAGLTYMAFFGTYIIGG